VFQHSSLNPSCVDLIVELQSWRRLWIKRFDPRHLRAGDHTAKSPRTPRTPGAKIEDRESKIEDRAIAAGDLRFLILHLPSSILDLRSKWLIRFNRPGAV
jgi:hypothetical protein